MNKVMNLDVFVGTWNVAEADPLEAVKNSFESYRSFDRDDYSSPATDVPSEYFRIEEQEYRIRNDVATDIEKWLHMDDKLADIYAIGFQEIEMTGKALITEQTEAKLKWEYMLKTIFSRQPEQFCQLAIHQLVGICLVIYIKRKHSAFVDNIRSCIIREGFSGVLGNKGSAAVRFDLYGVGYCFINCHLTAHQKNISDRNRNLNSILNTTRFLNSPSDQAFTVPDHPLIWLLGDFNYRIDDDNGGLTATDVESKILDGRLRFLLRFDQLTREFRRDNILLGKWGFQEGEITFAPTYKYIKGSAYYDSEENAVKVGKSQSTAKMVLGTVKKKKNRIPSWTDRVFFKTADYTNLTCTLCEYNRFESKLSDHRPVFATFRVMTTETDRPESDNTPKTGAPPPVPKHLLRQKKVSSAENLLSFEELQINNAPTAEAKQERRKTTTTSLEHAIPTSRSSGSLSETVSQQRRPLPTLPPRRNTEQQETTLRTSASAPNLPQKPVRKASLASSGPSPSTTTTPSSEQSQKQGFSGFNPRNLDRTTKPSPNLPQHPPPRNSVQLVDFEVDFDAHFEGFETEPITQTSNSLTPQRHTVASYVNAANRQARVSDAQISMNRRTMQPVTTTTSPTSKRAPLSADDFFM